MTFSDPRGRNGYSDRFVSSQIAIEPSNPTDESIAPSGRNSIDWTVPAWPIKVSLA